MKNIVVATDGSHDARKAVEVAADIAAAMGARLIIAHVLMHHRPPEELERMARVEHMLPAVAGHGVSPANNVPGSMIEVFEDIDRTADAERVVAVIGDQILRLAESDAKARGAKDVATEILSGDYAESIAEFAKKEGAEMIVVGTRGLGTIKGILLGSVSRKLSHVAECSVLTVK